MMYPRASHSFFLVALLLLNFSGFLAWGQNPVGIQIVIVEGEGAINNVRQRVNREPIVQVNDVNHKPVVGASVTFFLPNDGPGGVFMNGSTTLTTATKAQGQAVARGIRFNNRSGPMQIRVAASFAGEAASAVINQTNIAGEASSSGGSAGGMSRTTKLLILGAIVGAGVAVGVIVANQNSSSTKNPSTITITPGTVTVGVPQ
jgi:hypothetical protein